MQTIGLNISFIGLLIAIPNLTGSLLRISSAVLADKIGSGKPYLVLLGISVIGLVGPFFFYNTVFYKQ